MSRTLAGAAFAAALALFPAGSLASLGSLSLAVALAAPDAAATPTGGALPTRCDVEPRSDEDFEALQTAPPGVIQSLILGTPVATQSPPSSGSPADSVAAAAVASTIEEFAACGNAGDFRRATALLSDDYFFRFFGGMDAETLARFLAPAPLPPEEHVATVSVNDVRLLPDGRVSAITRLGDITNQVILVPHGDRYLIDSSSELRGSATPTP